MSITSNESTEKTTEENYFKLNSQGRSRNSGVQAQHNQYRSEHIHQGPRSHVYNCSQNYSAAMSRFARRPLKSLKGVSISGS